MSLLLLIGLRHLKLCRQPVCASLSPAGCIPPATLAPAPGWHPGSLGCEGEHGEGVPRAAALPNRRETLALSPSFWLLLEWSN